jgi:hypothetical protein
MPAACADLVENVYKPQRNAEQCADMPTACTRGAQSGDLRFRGPRPAGLGVESGRPRDTRRFT